MVTNLPAFAETDILRQGRPITYDQFRELLSYPTWNYFLQVIRMARAYNKGLTAGIHLLNLNEEYKDRLTQKEYDNHIRLLYGLCLDMLDNLDRWDDFLVAFDQVWKDQRFVFRCHKKSLNEEFGDLLAKGVVSETKHYIYVHEFYLHILRKEVIERKIQRREQGRKLGNMYHHTREDLTPEEVAYRQRWLKDLITDFKNQKSAQQTENRKY
jgi:hypothetical protein